MRIETFGKNLILFAKALLSNQIARFAPKLYVDLTRQTGRGAEEEESSKTADYFIGCFRDYQSKIGLRDEEIKKYLQGKIILEYGPGDILGVALLMFAYGAKTVHCVDRFPLSSFSNKNVEIYMHLLNSLDSAERERASTAFNEKGNPRSGFNPEAITYLVTPNGLSGSHKKYDLIISCAVLEHVNCLEGTMNDIRQSLKDDGISIHKVDLRSHGLDRYTDFDFLTWSTLKYNLMYSHKGYPNRWRVNKYRELAQLSKITVKNLSPTGRLGPEKIDAIYPKLAKEFRQISHEELAWLGFWMILERTR